MLGCSLPQSLSSELKMISSSEMSFWRFWDEFVGWGWGWVVVRWTPVSVSSSEACERFFMIVSFSFWSFMPPSFVFDLFRAIDGSKPSFEFFLEWGPDFSSA